MGLTSNESVTSSVAKSGSANSNTLAGFDMELALSQSTINFQFKQLYKRGIIHKDWGVLMGNITNPENGKDPFFLSAKTAEFHDKLSR